MKLKSIFSKISIFSIVLCLTGCVCAGDIQTVVNINDLANIINSSGLDSFMRLGQLARKYDVSIEDNVWLGSRVMVLKGVTIGENSVVGSMSLVTKSIPSNSIAAGVPAKVLRKI